MEKKLVWTDTYRVRSYEAGPGGKAQLTALCNYLQETAGRHAGHLTFGMDDLFREGKTWMLSRLKLRIWRYPSVQEGIRVKTWPRGTDKLFAIRDFEMYGGEGDKILAAVSAWLVIDLHTKRPLRPQSLRSGLPRELPGRALESLTAKLSGIRDGAASGPITAGFTDLDINQHVNNTQYITWILNHFHELNGNSLSCSELELNFLSECRAGDTVRVISGEDPDAPGTWHHTVERIKDAGKVCLANTQWHKN